MNIILEFKRVAMLACVAALSFFQLGAQETSLQFRYPLDVAMSLSGNYGELRSNHFHNGVDFRVGGVIGAPIYATAEGYISRITVSPSGYGNAIYITHPNGYLSVYGHMHCFAEHIAEYVRERQYEQESFRQDITFTPNQFPIKKGEYIGKAGNSGSSGGPHLHFEIRDENNNPTNPFARGYFSISDHLPPVIRGVLFYGLEYLNGVADSYYIGAPKQGVMQLPEHSYICIDAIDKQEGTNAKLAVNEYKVWLDTTLVYHLSIGEVPMDLGRDINSLIEYKQKVVRNRTYIKSYVEPGNLLQDRIKSNNCGVIRLNDTLNHKIKIEVSDINNNRSFKSYTVRRVDSLYTGKAQDSLQNCNSAVWFLPNFHNADGMELYIPRGVLYNSIYLNVDTLQTRITPYAPVWNIATDKVSLRKNCILTLECNLPDSLISKAFIAQVYKGGKLGYVGGKYDRSKKELRANILTLGSFTVAVDLLPPEIKSALANNAVVKGNSVVFKIKDNLSGVKDYRVEIDGHWVLAEYDAKTRRVIVPLQHARIRKGKKHSLLFKVQDNCGNTSVIKRNFTW